MQDPTPERKDVVKGAIKREASEVQMSSRMPSSPMFESMGSPRSQGKQMQETTPERKDAVEGGIKR